MMQSSDIDKWSYLLILPTKEDISKTIKLAIHFRQKIISYYQFLTANNWFFLIKPFLIRAVMQCYVMLFVTRSPGSKMLAFDLVKSLWVGQLMIINDQRFDTLTAAFFYWLIEDEVGQIIKE